MNEATLTRPNYDEDLLTEDEEYKPEQLFDEFGNPTPALLEAFYEDEHGMVDIMTVDEFKAELDEIFGTD